VPTERATRSEPRKALEKKRVKKDDYVPGDEK